MLTTKIVEEQTIMVLKEIYDPELPVNIYDLGLIYFVNVKESISNDQEFFVNVEMTVTSPNCPAIETLPQDIIDARAALRIECATKEDEINALSTKASIVDYQLPSYI